MPGNEFLGKEELKEISKLFDNGANLFRYGNKNNTKITNYVETFEKNFSNFYNQKYSLAVSSGTAALRVALASLDIGRGDEVITQSFTFVATVEAIVESGATPICLNIDKTLNLDPSELKKKITKKTKAVILVHMLGSPGHIIAIRKICKKFNVKLIEDTAWGLGGIYHSQFLGTFGDIGTFSFDYAKTITTGEGGMLIFKNKKIFEKAKAWHDHGHENNPKLPRWKDSRKSSGFNFRISELTGAIGVVQLKKLNNILNLQRKNGNYLIEKFKQINSIHFALREVPENTIENNDVVIIIFNNKLQSLYVKKILEKNNLPTKILPEAITWHFSYYWTHIKELKQKNLKKSYGLLSRSLAIPINCKMTKTTLNKYFDLVILSTKNEKIFP